MPRGKVKFYDAEKGFTTKGVDPSWTAFLGQLEGSGVDRETIAREMDFIKDFVRNHPQQQAPAPAAPQPKEKKTKKRKAEALEDATAPAEDEVRRCCTPTLDCALPHRSYPNRRRRRKRRRIRTTTLCQCVNVVDSCILF